MGAWTAAIVEQVKSLMDGPSFIFTRTVVLKQADLFALFNTPFELIPAPGAGRMIGQVSATLRYKPGGVAYTVGAGTLFALGVGNNPNVGSAQAAMLGALVPAAALLVQGASAFASFENAAVKLSQTTNLAPLALGDGELICTVVFFIFDTTL